MPFSDRLSPRLHKKRNIVVLWNSLWPTLLDRDVASVEGSNKARLGQRVFKGEELVLGDVLGSRLEDSLGTDGAEVGTLAVTQRQLAAVVLGRVQAVWVAHIDQLALPAEVLVVACVQSVFARLVHTELQREQRVFAPRDVRIHMNLVQVLRQVSEPLAAH